MTGRIFNIQRFSTNDGPGIRTTVFFKGCPLSCVWCHNPESKSVHFDLFYDPQKCVNCKICAESCPQNLHTFLSDQHLFSRESCSLCMECVSHCPAGALERCGEETTVARVMEEVLKDREFYHQSGGGLTLSGGEPLLQYEFALALLKEAKKEGLHTAVETSGYCHRELNEIQKYVDLWLYDIKLFGEQEHIEYTGVSNGKILENLMFLDSIGADIVLRCPVVLEVNFTREHFHELIKLVNQLQHVVAIHLEPYHPLGIDKAMKLGTAQKYCNSQFLSADELLPVQKQLKEETGTVVEIL